MSPTIHLRGVSKDMILSLICKTTYQKQQQQQESPHHKKNVTKEPLMTVCPLVVLTSVGWDTRAPGSTCQSP